MCGRAGRRLILALLLLGLAGAASGAETPSDTTAVDSAGAAEIDGSWLTRTLKRYFGGGKPPGEPLEGQAVEIVDAYAKYLGKPIEVVIVNQVARFDRSWSSGHGTSQRLFDTAAKPFQTYTRDSTIRQYILFHEGEVVDPFLIADTERMLRSLDFIEEVRIIIVPLLGEIESVAIVVETRDRWPIGVAAVVKDVGRYEVSLYSSNVGGIGLRFENRVIYRDDREPNLGYRGSLRKSNLGGSFVDGVVEFEDSYRRNHLGLGLERELSHPSIKWVGGISWLRTRERDAGPDPNKQELGDAWLGQVIPLRPRPVTSGTARPVLVPAVRFNRRTFLDRPVVSRDTLRQYHNNQNYLVGLTYQRFKYYRTNYLFEMGETEDVPSGVVLKVSGGYQDGEFHDRAQAFFQSSYYAARSRGDLAFLRLDLGGFFRSGEYEDGSLIAKVAYFTALRMRGNWRSRFLTVVSYYRAINRVSDRVLRLGDASDIRGMDNNRVAGNQRLVGTFEYRVFPAWSVMGFRFLLLGFLDTGVVAGEHDQLLRSKFYASSGLAVRIQNPELVFPPLQLRVAIRNSIDDKGVLVGFRVGGEDSPEILVPGARPGGFSFR